jgi:cytoskeletal protein CcmA (bactofilin family)
MFRKREDIAPSKTVSVSTSDNRVTSVLGAGIAWKGSISGSGGVRVEGAFDGNIHMRGMLVVGETGRVTCENVRANLVIVAGALQGNITAQKVEIRSTGRVWGDVVTSAFATEEGAFLRGQITMEEGIDITTPNPVDEFFEDDADEAI